MRQAVLDIGTNTVKILVAEVDVGRVTPRGKGAESGDSAYRTRITPVFEDALTTRLGQGVNETRTLKPEAVERTLSTISDFTRRARELGAEKILAFATSAVREARNGQEFLDAVKKTISSATVSVALPIASGTLALPHPVVKILSGEEEARYAFAGVASDPAFAGKAMRTIDIGGGSTEICIGKSGSRLSATTGRSTEAAPTFLRAHHSLNIGAVRLTEMFLKSDPPSEREWAAMAKHVRAELRSLPSSMEERPQRRDKSVEQVTEGRGAEATPTFQLIATGGTALTLAAIELNRKDGGTGVPPVRPNSKTGETPVPPLENTEAHDHINVDHRELTLGSLDGLVDWLRKLPLAQRMHVAGLPPARADIIVAGAAILAEAMRFFGAPSVVVSVRGVRYGALVIGAGEGV